MYRVSRVIHIDYRHRSRDVDLDVRARRASPRFAFAFEFALARRSSRRTPRRVFARRAREGALDAAPSAVMARSAGGSTGAASLTTLDATTSEGDTHLSPMLMRARRRRTPRRRRAAGRRPSAPRRRARRGRRDRRSGWAARAARARRGDEGRGTRRRDARRDDDGDDDADDDADVERSARDADDDGGDASRMPAVDAAAVTRSIENPGHATVIGDDGARRAATHSIQNSQAVRSNDDVVNGDEAGNVRRARAGDGRGGGGDGRRDECGRRGAARRGARVDA